MNLFTRTISNTEASKLRSFSSADIDKSTDIRVYNYRMNMIEMCGQLRFTGELIHITNFRGVCFGKDFLDWYQSKQARQVV